MQRQMHTYLCSKHIQFGFVDLPSTKEKNHSNGI